MYLVKLRIRLRGEEIKTIRNLAEDIFVSPYKREQLFEKRIKLEAKLKNLLGKPVDVVVSRDFDRSIEKEALKGARVN